METKIRFLEARVLNFALSSNPEPKESEFELTFFPAFIKEDLREFLIVFEVEIVSSYPDEEGKALIQIQYAAKFQTSDDITEEFMNSKFVELNAPAIAYPYLRAFVSNFTINAGLKPLVLDTINFVNGFDKKKIDEENTQ